MEGCVVRIEGKFLKDGIYLLFVNRTICRFAYVDFSTPDAKTTAITLSEKNLDGRRLLIKDGLCIFYGHPSDVYRLLLEFR